MKTIVNDCNVLLLNGSPRHGGTIDRLLSAVREEAEIAGRSVREWRVIDLHITPCCGCMRCRSGETCPYAEDDVAQVLAAIRDAEVVVVGAPCYWGGVPGHLKVLLDRMVAGMIDTSGPNLRPRPLLCGRKALIVTCSTTPRPFTLLSRYVSTGRTLEHILRASGFSPVKRVHLGGTHRCHVMPKSSTLTRIHRLVRRLFAR